VEEGLVLPASQEIRPTRIELINTNRRIKLAKRGLDLLKMKRSSLVMEFFKISRTLTGRREALREEIGNALESLRIAGMISGSMNLERVSLMFANTYASVKARNVMGVRIPELELNYGESAISELYRATSVPVPINESISKFEGVLVVLLEVAEKENSMRRLLREIEKTKRRSNAIENVMIPRLTATAKYIRMRLDEIERETFTTLKTIKKKMAEETVAV
jgi:V/A-type H+-transporting ATPase subunit D